MPNFFTSITAGNTTKTVQDPNAVPLVGKGINLLDNWYFVGGGTNGKFPINQRGEPSYSGEGGTIGTIDRWKLYDLGDIIPGGTGLQLQLTKNAYLYQQVENYYTLAGAAVTLTALNANGELVTGSCNIPNTYPDSSATWIDVYYRGSGKLISVQLLWDTIEGLSVRFAVHGTLPAQGTIVAIKLEVGDTQTLAREVNGSWVLNDPAPNYCEEQARCQRYLAPIKTSDLIHGISISGTYYFDVPTHQQMASAPVLTDALDLVLVANGGTERVIIPADTSGAVGGAGVGFSVAVGSIGNLQTAVAQVQQNTFLSCE